MENFAKKCIQDHRNPIVKVCLPAQKLFLCAKTEEERQLINLHQEHYRSVLEHQRIEKRSGRAQAVWLPDNNIAKVTKVVKNLVKYFGFQNKNGIFLYPEEMLFLLETNRLEINCNDNVFSIEKGYEIVLNKTSVSLSRYRIYKKLALLGYKLVRFEQIDNKILNRTKKNEVKRTLEHIELQAHKKFKPSSPFACGGTDQSEVDNDNNDQDCLQKAIHMPKEAEYVYNILNKITNVMPKDTCNNCNCLTPDYCIYAPMNLGKLEPDFHLFICEDNILDQKNFNSKIPSIFATCIDDVAFYKFSNVHLPFM